MKSKKKVKKVDIVAEAITAYKKDNSDWKEQDQHELYAIESHIDGLLYEERYAKYEYVGSEEAELILEGLVFEAIKKLQGGRRHTCDMYYDDAFNGYDGL